MSLRRLCEAMSHECADPYRVKQLEVARGFAASRFFASDDRGMAHIGGNAPPHTKPQLDVGSGFQHNFALTGKITKKESAA